jgi:hypothetical protein
VITTMEVDDTTTRFVTMLQEVLTQEPPVPDPDVMGAHGVAEAELKHYEWQRHVNALRLLIGVRLTTIAVEGGLT